MSKSLNKSLVASLKRILNKDSLSPKDMNKVSIESTKYKYAFREVLVECRRLDIPSKMNMTGKKFYETYFGIEDYAATKEIRRGILLNKIGKRNGSWLSINDACLDLISRHENKFELDEMLIKRWVTECKRIYKSLTKKNLETIFYEDWGYARDEPPKKKVRPQKDKVDELRRKTSLLRKRERQQVAKVQKLKSKLNKMHRYLYKGIGSYKKRMNNIKDIYKDALSIVESI